ncbi:phosphotransferase [Micromonospora sp. WMMD710]|uniref:phosphotransferase n=1 Tax=Micromonospora sp. WMMD710 TaxID=3016085 RepID=UPI002415B450|nr:phosphotransferase [Micromonospora sp. WMMD710]MDG4760453.1 phosphotransferase [Micromonospora sp. WMMD710]
MFAALVARAAAVRVGTGRVVHRTDKAVVATGRRDGQPVIVKLLTTDDPYWVGRRQHELRMYELFTDQPPPVRVPRVLYADARLTVLTQLPGQRLDDQRHFTHDVGPGTARLVLDTLDTFATWTPARPLPQPVDYHGRIDADHAAGLLDDADQYPLHFLVDQLGSGRVTAHGDPLPANLLLDGEHCALVDFEHSGSYLPGYDLALLHIVGAAASPTLTAAIAERVHTANITTAYHVNLLLLTCREIRLHTVLAAGNSTASRLAYLRQLLSRARHDVQALMRWA